MAPALYRNTFLQVPLDEEQSAALGRRRASSVPARTPGQVCAQTDQSEKYLNGVFQQLETLWARGVPPVMWNVPTLEANESVTVQQGPEIDCPADPALCEVAEKQGDGFISTDDEFQLDKPRPNVESEATAQEEVEHWEPPAAQLLPGSLGHPEFCRRPCIFYASGNCDMGAACKYCHEPHRRKVKLHQVMRLKLQAMKAPERLEMLLQILQKKEAAMPPTLPSIQPLIDLLEQVQDSVQPVQNSAASDRKDRKAVQAVLAKMPVSALLGDFVTSEFDPELCVGLQQALQNIRETCDV